MDEQVLMRDPASRCTGSPSCSSPDRSTRHTARSGCGSTPGGFGGVAAPVRVEGADLVWEAAGAARRHLSGARRGGGLERSAPDLYADDSASTRTTRWPSTRTPLVGCSAGSRARRRGAAGVRAGRGAGALARALRPRPAPGRGELRRLARRRGHGAPYAYVGPWTPRTGEFWNASFGALRPADTLPDAAAVQGFFTDGREAAAAGAPPG